MTRCNALILTSLLLALLSCGDDPSQIIIEISADADVIASTSQLELAVAGRPGKEAAEQFETRGFIERPVSPEQWPLRHVLGPKDEDSSRIYRVTVTAQGDTPDGFGLVSETRAVSGFVKGQTRVLRLHLLGGPCFGEQCALDRSCAAVDETVFECRTLEVIDPATLPREGESPDASKDGGPDGDADAGPTCPTEACEVPGEPCAVGRWDCSGDENVCIRESFAQAGTVCGPEPEACQAGRAQCTGDSGLCPPNPLKSTGDTCGDGVYCIDGACRACEAGVACTTTQLCEVGEIVCQDGVPSCVGTGQPKPSGTLCRAKSEEANTCDIEDRCDGTALTCADRMQAAGTECRPTRGGCDVAETCVADSKSCPPDGRRQQGYVCRGAEGLCDLEERCDGESDACPADLVKGGGSVCRMAGESQECDPAESCDGQTRTCPSNAFTELNTPCANGNVCDGNGHCADLGCGDPCVPANANPCKNYTIDCEQGGACVASGNKGSTEVCKRAEGACDADDTCDGSGKCIEKYASAGTSCGDSTSNECNGADTCDGSGVCHKNFAKSGTACGDRSDTDCTDPDTCDGIGGCKPNHASSIRPCEDGLACTTGDRCSGQGACVGGPPPACSPAITECVSYSCVEATGGCTMTIAPDTCFIKGVCYAKDDQNPENSCEVCAPSTSRDTWSKLITGCMVGDECFNNGDIDPYSGCQVCGYSLKDELVWMSTSGARCSTPCRSNGTCNGTSCQGGTAINGGQCCTTPSGTSGGCVSGSCSDVGEIICVGTP